MDGMQNLLSDLILFRLPEGSLPQRLLSSDAAARSELVVRAVHGGWQGDLWHCCLVLARL